MATNSEIASPIQGLKSITQMLMALLPSEQDVQLPNSLLPSEQDVQLPNSLARAIDALFFAMRLLGKYLPSGLNLTQIARAFVQAEPRVKNAASIVSSEFLLPSDITVFELMECG